MNYSPTPQRVEESILRCFEADFNPTPDMVAEDLVDQDVSNGLYEGCSTELELAYQEFENEAVRQLG
jgi:hypothetical protein